jgi:hypothetical protein
VQVKRRVRQWTPTKDVQAFGHAQDDSGTQAQADIHTPVEEGQNEEIKLFGAHEAEEPGWSHEPGSAGLQSGDEVDAPVQGWDSWER